MTSLLSDVHFQDDAPGDINVALRRYMFLARIGWDSLVTSDDAYVPVNRRQS